MNKCPVCGEAAVVQCKCMRGDSTCKNGHQWHRCEVHGIVVLWQSDHSRPGCSCLQSMPGTRSA